MRKTASNVTDRQRSMDTARGPIPVDWAFQTGYAPPHRRVPIDLKLDSNEGPLPDGLTLDSLSANVLQSYPNKDSLESLLADRFRLCADQVLVTSGGDDAIDRVCRAFLQPGRELVVPQPTFEMIPQYARIAGASICTVPWPGGSFPTEEVIQAATDRTAVIAIVSPNNPTGSVATEQDLQQIAAACPHALLLVDLAYVEFVERDFDLTQAALQIPTAVVIRTFSKAWGLAGLRVGYALSSSDLINVLDRAGSPYPVSGPSLSIASAALRQMPNGRADYVAAVKRERIQLNELLAQLGGQPIDSQGNFVFCQFGVPTASDKPTECRDAAFVCDSLAALGIAVRSFPSIPNAIRITCPGNERDFARLSNALRASLAPQAILFDMDGVLADEAPSYRQAIQQTCVAFGHKVGMEEIARRKLAGNANNDWDFTFELLADLGAECTFDEVKLRFEALYQGTETEPGLWRHERLLIDPIWLRDLSQLLPLGIVTGRPRADARRFLEQHNILNCFSTLVCMEDGPAKPDAAPVRLALKQLNTKHAWMIGDTPDDLNAARAAGVIPLGVVAPADDAVQAAEMLRSAAAVRVLDRVESLTQLLPR